jgi:hypothetical protein
MNQPLAAAEVRRRTSLIGNPFRLLTSAATVQGFKARTLARRFLSPGERAGVRVSATADFRVPPALSLTESLSLSSHA